MDINFLSVFTSDTLKCSTRALKYKLDVDTSYYQTIDLWKFKNNHLFYHSEHFYRRETVKHTCKSTSWVDNIR